MADKQPTKESIRKKTLALLVHQTGLQPEQLATLRLSDLQLAGKTPNIRLGGGKTAELDLDAHRALVGWLVARPDSVNDNLFIGNDLEGMSPEDIKDAIDDESLINLDTSPPPPAGPREQTQESPVAAPSEPPAVEEDLPFRAAKPPMPPQSRPEAGPPSGGPPMSGTSAPPPTVPEMDESPAAGRTPSGSTELPPPPESQPEPPLPFSRPMGIKKTRVPPKPIRKREGGPDPVLVQQDPEPPPLPVREAPEPGEPLPAAPDPTQFQEKSAPDSAGPLPVPSKGTPASASRPMPVPVRQQAMNPQAVPARPASGATPPAMVPSNRPPSDPASNPEYWKNRASASGSSISTTVGPPRSRREYIPFAIGGIVVVLLLCAACVGAGSWLAVPDGAAGGILASLGFGDEPIEDTQTPTPQESASTSPTSTPTLPPTSTPTALPATNTPLPVDTDTPTPEPTAEPTQPPTDTPEPTATEAPTETPTPEEPPTPAETSTPAEPPTPAMKYGAPVLLGPEDGQFFSGINEIILEWQPVDLGPDEQYAVRIVYPYNGQPTYGGAQVKEPRWVVPLQLMGKIDPPDNLYTWFVVVERLNSDGSGTAISPESARRTFIWKVR